MRKSSLFIGMSLLLVACNADEEGNATSDQEQPQSSENIEGESDPFAEEVVQRAAMFFEDLDGLYFEVEGQLDVTVDRDGNVIEDGENVTMLEKHWHYMKDDEYYNRFQIDTIQETEENGELKVEEEPTSYTFTDRDDPEYQFDYNEGDESAIRYEVDRVEEIESIPGAAPHERRLEESVLTYLGEEDVNGYQTYVVQSEIDDMQMTHWYDQDTYYEVQSETVISRDDEDNVETISIITVLDFEKDPEFEESLFTVPDEVEVVEGDIMDTVGDE
ncbi:hypothetical protein [Geomicrobium sediminis]|uniref:Outer membrane lipoprotein-sorting protein n=1 Tax=Geomicrobium sediminis TaxID=1347788 RepID=A0ABS2P7N7_9BACL|nr:hypothetical protein [Geomicrobium sediminis]MBM7631026.1 hypothetical protein [Geomicrobium sediminis]